jgi:hypothetical protein
MTVGKMSVRQNVFRQSVFRQSVFRQNVRVPATILVIQYLLFIENNVNVISWYIEKQCNMLWRHANLCDVCFRTLYCCCSIFSSLASSWVRNIYK